MTGDTLAKYQRYFTDFLPALSGQLLIEDLHDLNAVFEICVRSGVNTAWQIQIADGRIADVRPSQPGVPCRFVLDKEVFFPIVAGRQAPQQAFFEGQVDIEGDIELGMKLSTVLEPFFRQYPYLP